MPRTLSSAIQSVIAEGKPSRVVHLLTFTVGATIYRFAEDRVSYLGNLYEPSLVVESPVRYSQKPQLNPVTLTLQNITLETAQMLQNEQPDAQGVEATLERLFLQANEAVILFRGRIGEVAMEERSATLTLQGDLDPTATEVPQRKYSNLCVWDFKDTNCGYVDGVDPDDPATGQPFTTCPKDFSSCQARGREHRFPGFLHITRALTEAVEGQLPDAQPDERTLGEFNVWD